MKHVTWTTQRRGGGDCTLWLRCLRMPTSRLFCLGQSMAPELCPPSSAIWRRKWDSVTDLDEEMWTNWHFNVHLEYGLCAGELWKGQETGKKHETASELCTSSWDELWVQEDMEPGSLLLVGATYCAVYYPLTHIYSSEDTFISLQFLLAESSPRMDGVGKAFAEATLPSIWSGAQSPLVCLLFVFLHLEPSGTQHRPAADWKLVLEVSKVHALLNALFPSMWDFGEWSVFLVAPSHSS